MMHVNAVAMSHRLGVLICITRCRSQVAADEHIKFSLPGKFRVSLSLLAWSKFCVGANLRLVILLYLHVLLPSFYTESSPSA